MAGPGLQVTTLSEVSLSEFTDLTRKEFSMTQMMVPVAARQLFIEVPIASNSGNTRRFDEVDTETFASLKREGENAAKASAGVGYNVTMTARRFAKEIDITYEMRRDNRAPEVGSALVSLAHHVPQRQELDLTHRLTFASSTSYTDKDGVSVDVSVGDTLALVSASHTLAFSSATYSNRVSGDPVFSQGALESALLLSVTNIRNNFGDKRVMNFNTIISGDDPGTVRDIRQVLESTADVDAAHEGVLNHFRGRMRHVMLPYLATTATGAYDSTKRRWWGIAATGQGTAGWQAYLGIWEQPNLKTPAPGNNGEDVHSDNWTYGARGRYGIAAVSGRGIILSLPTS